MCNLSTQTRLHVIRNSAISITSEIECRRKKKKRSDSHFWLVIGWHFWPSFHLWCQIWVAVRGASLLSYRVQYSNSKKAKDLKLYEIFRCCCCSNPSRARLSKLLLDLISSGKKKDLPKYLASSIKAIKALDILRSHRIPFIKMSKTKCFNLSASNFSKFQRDKSNWK